MDNKFFGMKKKHINLVDCLCFSKMFMFKHINLLDCLCFSKMFMFKKDVFRLVKSMGQRKKF